MIKPDLRDLINKHKPTERLINNNNTIITILMMIIIIRIIIMIVENEKLCQGIYIKCISAKSFNEIRTTHPQSRQVEVYRGTNTEDVIDTLFNTLLQNFQRIQET